MLEPLSGHEDCFSNELLRAIQYLRSTIGKPKAWHRDLPGPSGPEPQKSPKRVRRGVPPGEPQSLWNVGLAAGGPGTPFRTLFGLFWGSGAQKAGRPLCHPRKGGLESKNPHFYTGHHRENGDSLTRDALFWGGGKWSFFDSETLFSRFWVFFFDPCKGQTDSQAWEFKPPADPLFSRPLKNYFYPHFGVFGFWT